MRLERFELPTYWFVASRSTFTQRGVSTGASRPWRGTVSPRPPMGGTGWGDTLQAARAGAPWILNRFQTWA